MHTPDPFTPRALEYHFAPRKGWMNDPNGLVYFQGYYHMFYQHAPDYEIPWQQSMHWGHARTRDFLHWEELPVALYPDQWYDHAGCFSGTAIVKEDKLYLIYASIHRKGGTEEEVQSVSVAISADGVHFEKHPDNPVIPHFPPEGGPDFRDPAVCRIDGKYYCVMATGHPETQTARLLLYESPDLVHWEYKTVMTQWDHCRFSECPSLVQTDTGCLLAASVCPLDSPHYFRVMMGTFTDGVFTPRITADVDKGPDQYAGQVFRAPDGRALMITWIPGWEYSRAFSGDAGCQSVPRELFLRDGKIFAYPAKEVQHLLRDSDPAVERTPDGFIIRRQLRPNVVHTGEIRDIKILRDNYILEIFVNGGETVYSVLLC
ncbi:MAG: glycoside hydrolase family 32 protein [Clostridiales bacterium]|nr:glycoside hydrolase family 32 protein [Clostridiales bacterium]